MITLITKSHNNHHVGGHCKNDTQEKKSTRLLRYFSFTSPGVNKVEGACDVMGEALELSG